MICLEAANLDFALPTRNSEERYRNLNPLYFPRQAVPRQAFAKKRGRGGKCRHHGAIPRHPHVSAGSATGNTRHGRRSRRSGMVAESAMGAANLSNLPNLTQITEMREVFDLLTRA
jgi:hypothetical protein